MQRVAVIGFLSRGAVVAAVLLVGQGCAMTRVREPSYLVEFREEPFEIRRYGARVVAETRVEGEWSEAGSEGFRRLAGYIFGRNRQRVDVAMTAPVGQRSVATTDASRRVAMTAPVSQTRRDGSWIVAFTMPADETLSTLPTPLDSRIALRAVDGSRVAVIRFRGRWTTRNMSENESRLRAWLATRGATAVGAAEVNRFDPPYVPWFLRRNEIWLPIDEG